MESSESVSMSNSSSLSSIESVDPHLNSHSNFDHKKSKFRYDRDFLTNLRQERSKFIDTIYPDIFKAYCYCMNGKYWNPEKYFEVVQYSYPQDFDKIRKPARNQHYQSKMIQTSRKPQQTSIQPRQRHYSTQSNQSGTSEADRILLNLIKQKPTITSVSQETPLNNILEKLLNKANQSSKQQSATSNILDLLTKRSPSSSNGTVLMAQELEANLIQKSQNTKIMNFFSQHQQAQKSQENLLEKIFSTKSTSFPAQNPHEKPSFQTSEPLNDITIALNKILKSNSPSPTKSTTLSTSSSVDAIFNKLRVTSQNTSPIKAQTGFLQNNFQQDEQHFNFLLGKISRQQQQKQQQQQQQEEDTSILKWFKNVAPTHVHRLPENIKSLADIESSH